MLDAYIQHEEETWGKIFSQELSKTTFMKFSSFWWEEYYIEITNFIVQKLDHISKPSILEAGSWSGKASLILWNKVEKITLLDISENALQYAKFLAEKLGSENVEYIRWDIFNLPFQDNVFDLTWNIWVLEHYEIEKFPLVLNQMIRVTQNWWFVAFWVPNFYSWPTLKAWLLSKRAFSFLPWYRLDTEKFFQEKELIDIIKRLWGNEVKIEDIQINYFWSFLPMETPKFILKLAKPFYNTFKKNKFLTFISFKVIK